MTDLESYNKVEYRAGNIIQAAVTAGFLESFTNGSRQYFFTGTGTEIGGMIFLEFKVSDRYDDFNSSMRVPVEWLNENIDQSALVAYFEALVTDRLAKEAEKQAAMKDAAIKLKEEKDRAEFERLKAKFGE